MLSVVPLATLRGIGGPDARIGVFQRSRRYSSRGNPKRSSKLDIPQSEYLAHLSGIVTPREVLPQASTGPLPRKFSAEGYLGVDAGEEPAKLPASKKSKKKSAKKSLLSRFDDVKLLKMETTDGTAKDAIRRIELAKKELFGHGAGRKHKATYEDAVVATKNVIAEQEKASEIRREKDDRKYDHQFAAPDVLSDHAKDDALVDDPKLRKQWKGHVQGLVKRLKRKVLVRPPASSTASPSSSSPEKSSPESSESAKKDSTSNSKAKEGRKKRVSKRKLEAQIVKATKGGKKRAQKPTFKVSELTFMEGSKEDKMHFALDTEEIAGDQAKVNIMARPKLLRKKLTVPKRQVSFEHLESEEYLESVKRADEKAMQNYIDSYDHDSFSRPPIATYTYSGTFKDKSGKSPMIVDSMGTWLSMKTRGIRFDGTDAVNWTVRDYLISQDVALDKFDFHQPPYVKPDLEAGHSLSVPVLDKFVLDFAIPVKLAATDANTPAEEAKINVKTRHTLHWESFAIELVLSDGTTYRPSTPSIDSQGYPSSFDEQIKQIQLQLPANRYLKSCWNCALSEYSPLSKPASFGGLACFRQWSGITNVRDKLELLRNWNKNLEKVQETHSCDAFKRRTKPRIIGYNPTVKNNLEGLKQRKADEGSSNPGSGASTESAGAKSL